MGEARSAIIDYTYDSSTKRGYLTKSQIPIRVDSNLSEDSDKELIMRLSHESYLRCHFIDDISEYIVHEDFDYTLLEYLAVDKTAEVTPVMSYTIPNVHVEEEESETCYFVLDMYKNIIRSLVQFVVHIHKCGKSLKGLCVENLCISKSQLKVWGVRFKIRDAKSTREDFIFVHHIIVNILGIEKGSDVEQQLIDFGDLLNNLFNNSGENESYLERHWSLLSTKERLVFIKNSTYKSSVLDWDEFEKFEVAVSCMGNKSGWTERFLDPDSKLGPAHDCYHHPTAVPYESAANCYYTNWCILRFCRNMATHLLDHLKNHKKKEELNDHDVEMVILNEFGQELMVFYTNIMEKGLDGHFL